ncbi:nucleoside-diphosphate sugar epimerase/dehydratase [Bowmanella sp. JS7-9]|uniref:Polysaccharide biosynthesis protein n=1 Tax=Pseudobowmanella zhangzhouensis TaxID=1537679 RepID=A0ABW1XJK7_9ALTE|nr:nucleoside-diphosphate sugar epimerase/dehydratase [Bowmanella sp. JS7-9]
MIHLASIFRLPSGVKLSIAVLWDVSNLASAVLLAYWIRLGIGSDYPSQPEYVAHGLIILMTIMLLVVSGHYLHVVRYITPMAIAKSLGILAFSALVMVVSGYAADVFVPLSVPVIFWTLAGILMMGPRLLIHAAVNSVGARSKERCLIYGAADTGRTLAVTLKQNADLLPVAFIDDKGLYQGKKILGLQVHGREDIPRLVKKYNVTKMLLAVPHTSVARRKQLIRELEPFALELKSVPSVTDLVSGKSKINDLKEIQIEELLGREPVPPIESLMSPNITGKCVMVTGAGGSIGSELCRQIAKVNPESLVLFEISEFNLYQIESELRRKYPTLPVYPVLGTIQDSAVIRDTLAKYRINTIYHAAAYKHVPMVECNIMMGIRNNIFGTANVALIAAEFQVEKFVLVSTDKAVRPTNIMGATKRFAELYVQGIAELGTATEYAIVRFGNVLGSSGSVVPLFSQQLLKGGPITVTHPDIIRYFMTIPEAAQLVIQAGTMGKDGEVFVLDMGEPVRIADLATKMAHLMGLSIKSQLHPDGEIEMEFTGLRPGEKLYEELLIGDAETKTSHPRIMGANEVKLPFEEVVMLMDQLNFKLVKRDEEGALNILREAPLAYRPNPPEDVRIAVDKAS